jgi:lipopolysaccharide/colanic/teichoic acid biosynthesis glycosyltransferase
MDSPFRSQTSLNTSSSEAALLPAFGREEDPSLLSLDTAAPRGTAVQAVQRVLDVVLTSVLLLLLLPLFAVIALLIKIDSPGSVLFTQARVGKDGVEFPFFKFRSMVVDAEARRSQLEQRNERSGPVFKIKDDPRVTRVGRLLRKFSLDELPQLLNILRGEMSLVGPRPALPKEVAVYTDYQRQRLAVTPGLTGLWQVSGRASLSFERSIELDLFYIQHQSLRLNFVILLRTIPAVIKGDGAY